MNLTDRQFWLNYWESKSDLVFRIPEGFILCNFLDEIIQQSKPKTALEIGGFPGHYSVYLRKKYKIEATLLDFVVHQGILSDLLQTNDLNESDVGFIETDLFDYVAEKRFDLVFSNGLIEHFQDTKNIIQKHVEQLEKGGTLFLTLPNFRSLNGWFQKTFDPTNYAKHHIACMDIDFLKQTCLALNLKDVQVNYYGKFMLWLENEQEKPVWVRLLRKTIWLIGKIVFKIIPIESPWFSPYIIIKAQS